MNEQNTQPIENLQTVVPNETKLTENNLELLYSHFKMSPETNYESDEQKISVDLCQIIFDTEIEKGYFSIKKVKLGVKFTFISKDIRKWKLLHQTYESEKTSLFDNFKEMVHYHPLDHHDDFIVVLNDKTYKLKSVHIPNRKILLEAQKSKINWKTVFASVTLMLFICSLMLAFVYASINKDNEENNNRIMETLDKISSTNTKLMFTILFDVAKIISNNLLNGLIITTIMTCICGLFV